MPGPDARSRRGLRGERAVVVRQAVASGIARLVGLVGLVGLAGPAVAGRTADVSGPRPRLADPAAGFLVAERAVRLVAVLHLGRPAGGQERRTAADRSRAADPIARLIQTVVATGKEAGSVHRRRNRPGRGQWPRLRLLRAAEARLFVPVDVRVDGSVS